MFLRMTNKGKPSKQDSDDATPAPDLLATIASGQPVSKDRHDVPAATSTATTTADKRARNAKTTERKQTAKKQTPRTRKPKGSKTSSPKGTKMPFFDPSTREGRRGRLEWMVNHGIDTQARAAISDLEKMDTEDAGHDPNAKADPADVCAFLARAHLHGLDPAKVLLKTHGLKKVIHAVGAALGLAHLSGSLGGTLADYKDESQCLQGVASDQVSSATSSEGVEVSA